MAEAAEKKRGGGRAEAKLMVHTKGWQVASIDDNAFPGGHIYMTKMPGSAVILNCYMPGQADEMHLHPKEEHIFLVWKGKLHVSGIEDGEEMTLEPGQFAHIDANYYYRLHNPGTEPAVYYQFRTLPAKPPKRGIAFYSESARGKRELAAAGVKSEVPDWVKSQREER